MSRFLRGLWRAITVLRLALANVLFIIFLVVLWLVFRGEAPVPLPDQATLVLAPDGRVVDQRSAVKALALLGESEGAGGEVLLHDLVDAVDYAREDSRITGLVIELDRLLYIGQSKALELGAALERFRGAGKPIVAVGDYFTQDQYRLAVEADQIVMHPLGAVGLEGYATYYNYFADALEKLSVTVHIFRAGENKSFGEPFARNDMSSSEKALTERWLSRLWTNYTTDVEARRGLEPGSITRLINEYPQRLRAAGGDAATLALDAKLVDHLISRSERETFLSETLGVGTGPDSFETVEFGRYLRRMRPSALIDNKPRVAIVTAQGNMLPGEQEPGVIGGDSLAELLRTAAEQDNVAALVLRINTGGGSVFAAEVIRDAINRVRAEGLPVVVSMGAVAASGGYYIAAESDRIYATEATLTGSIGVFAAFPTVDRLLARGGIYTDGVGTTDFAGGLRPDRPLNPMLAESIQMSVNELHDEFISLVAQGRDLPVEQVTPIADGRVLAAGEALELGLVDEIGGLDSAIDGAARLAGVDDYHVIGIEPPLSPQQLLLRRVAELAPLGAAPSYTGVTAISQWLGSATETAELLGSFTDPRHLYMRCMGCSF